MKAAETINEAEARDAIYADLQSKGIKITKTLLDQVLDTAKDLSIAGLKKGIGIKMQNLGTLEIVTHEEHTRKVPVKNEDGTWGTRDVTTPAGRHVHFNIADKLLTEINSSGL